MKRFSTTKVIWFIAASIIAGYFIWWAVPTFLKINEDPRSQTRLSRIAAELNRSVPVMIDQETELMPVQSAEGILIYNYRLVHYSVNQVDRDKFAAGAKPRLRQKACATPETRDDFLKKGVTLRYAYYDKNKQPIATIDVTPADCGP